MQIIVNKLLVNYSELGSGKKVILFLHGWADSSKTFEMLSKEILAKEKDFRAVLLDLPGFGASNPPQEAWDLPDYSLFVVAFLQKLNLEPDVIIGHSNGGAIAINGLSEGSLKPSRLILIGCAGIRTKSIKKDALRLISKPAKLAIKATPKATQKRIKEKLYSAIGSDYLIAEHMQDTFRKVVSYDVQDDASKIKIPVCLIYGEIDTSTPPAYGQLFDKIIPNSTLHLIPMAGHFVHQEQVPKVTRICSEFMQEEASS